MATHQLKLVPFPIVKSVTLQMPPRGREEGMLKMPGLPLSEISVDTLVELCDDFKAKMLMERENQLSQLLEQQTRNALDPGFD